MQRRKRPTGFRRGFLGAGAVAVVVVSVLAWLWVDAARDRTGGASPAETATGEPEPVDDSGTTGGHGAHGGDPGSEEPLSGTEAMQFDGQWSQAVDAAASLSTLEQAEMAGYAQAGPEVPGVGAHWIKWELVDAPFEPTRPSMLLFDLTPNRPARLAGFSYWTRSATAPAGFAGSNDHWHQHSGLCFADGWLLRENVPTAAGCSGEWFSGADRWMLHAWVVPDVPNSAGRFAGQNRALCPSDFARLPDVARCEPPS